MCYDSTRQPKCHAWKPRIALGCSCGHANNVSFCFLVQSRQEAFWKENSNVELTTSVLAQFHCLSLLSFLCSLTAERATPVARCQEGFKYPKPVLSLIAVCVSDLCLTLSLPLSLALDLLRNHCCGFVVRLKVVQQFYCSDCWLHWLLLCQTYWLPRLVVLSPGGLGFWPRTLLGEKDFRRSASQALLGNWRWNLLFSTLWSCSWTDSEKSTCRVLRLC